MLHKETVTAGTLDLLKRLMSDENLSDFFLVGGTALSLQIGHRISIDIDLFTEKSFDENKLLSYLETEYRFQLDYLDKNTIKGQSENVKVDLITHSYPLVNEMDIIEEIRMAGIADIAAMKLNAIIGNGTRLKDFIDVAYISGFISLKEMVNAYESKYSSRNPFLAIKALMFHQDINFDEPIQLLNKKYTWKAIEKRLLNIEKYPSTVFDTPAL